MRIGWTILVAIAFLLGLAWTSQAQDYGKLLSKSCYIVKEGVGKGKERCTLHYEKATVWTLDGKPYAYYPITEKQRRELAELKKLPIPETHPDVAEKVYTGAQVADLATTAVGTLGGIAREGNPILAPLFGANPIIGLIGAGLLKLGTASYLHHKTKDLPPEEKERTFAASSVVTFFAVLLNLAILF